MIKSPSVDPAAYTLPEDGNGPYRLFRGLSMPLVREFQASLVDPMGAQIRRLDAIIAQAEGTAFGAAHGLRRGDSLEQWREKVPLRSYGELEPWMKRVHAGEDRVLTKAPVQMLLKTSGTTGAAKLLPVTEPYAQAVDAGQALWRLALMRDHEGVTKGRAFTVVSPPVEGRLPSGLPYGSNTGRMQSRQPWYVRARVPVPPQVAAITDSPVRIYCLLRFALQTDISSFTTANPSTLLLLFRKLQEHWPDLVRDLRDGTLSGPASALPRRTRWALKPRLRRRRLSGEPSPLELWDLAVLNTWKGGPAQFFLPRLRAALGPGGDALPIRELGVTASEGYFAIPMSDGDEGGVAWLGGQLLEFVDDAGSLRWAWELEAGQRYRLVISSTGGLYRYDMNDILECTGHVHGAPLLRFVRKGGNMLNVTGEKLSEDQLVHAVSTAVGSGVAVAGFSVGYRMDEVPVLRVAVEGSGAPGFPADFAQRFDRALQEGNVEYQAKRESMRIGAPELLALPEGTYARWRAAKVAAGAPHGQIKDPVVLRDEAAWEALLAAR
ncbi:MAG: GH3 auxin-responsive promoter family protein [Myxococcota bacterium]|nr:GH3 auxin-responsive promoter family protein [Myxococcota bacterium]